MSKILTLEVLRTAQGVRAISSYTAGYTSTDFVSGPDSFGSMTYPVVAQFAPPPDVMTSFNPTNETITIQATLASSLSKSYERSIGSSYTTAEAREALENAFKNEFGITAWPAAEKNDLANGIFSCKYNRSNGVYFLCPTPTVSNMRTYSRQEPYMFDLYGNPIAWMTVHYVSGTCSLSSGTYTMSKTIGTSGRTDVNGMAFWAGKGNWTISAASPSLTLTYNEGLIVAVAGSPSGYIDKATETIFTWRTTWTGFPVENVAQTSATLQWKDGESGTVNSIPISGSATSYTMAADTLPESDAILWRVQTVTASGNGTSSWISVRTVDTEAVVSGVSPDGMYIDGTETSRFVWHYQTASGTAQKGYDLQVKGPSDTEYQTIKSETTPNTFALVPAGTLPPGAIQWRVRGYNQSSVAGEWSAPLQAVVIAAPLAPEVQIVSATCRPTVSWTSVGQLAYQVRIEGVYDSGTVFGTGKTFKIPTYLETSTYAIGVRILGEYDYWSPWAYASAAIENAYDDQKIMLTAAAQDGDAVLSWTPEENAEKYLVYRQGKLIAETTETQYTDPYAIGGTTYRVRAVFASSDDYVLSGSASVMLSVRAPRMITPGGTWIDLGLSTEPLPAPTIVAAQAVTLMTYAGVEYPVPEIAPHKTRTYTCSPAFRTAQEAAVLESLLGQVVFLKDQNENSLTGILTAVQLRPGSMYTVASITVNEIGGVSL